MANIIRNVSLGEKRRELDVEVFPAKTYGRLADRSNNSSKGGGDMNYDAEEAQAIFNEIDMEIELHVNATNGGF